MLICLLDQYFKNKVEKMTKIRYLFNGHLKISKTHNYGLCLNKLEKHPKIAKILSGLCLIGYLIYCFPRYGIGTYLVAFGGASNLYDRIKRGYVVDYIQFPKSKYKSKVVYNLADFEIFLGLFLTICKELKKAS